MEIVKVIQLRWKCAIAQVVKGHTEISESRYTIDLLMRRHSKPRYGVFFDTEGGKHIMLVYREEESNGSQA